MPLFDSPRGRPGGTDTVTTPEQPPSARAFEAEVPWWLRRGVGFGLLAAVVGIGWVFSWGVAVETAHPTPQTVSRWAEVNASTPTQLGASTAPPREEPSRPTSPYDGRELEGTDSAQRELPRSTPAQSSVQAKLLRDRQQARIRRAERRDRELAAFIEAAGLVQQMWAAPISGLYRITATFGATGSLWSADHTGVDLAAPSGTPVTAVAAGTVTSADDAGAYGLRVAVAHADGTETWYAHLSRIDVSVGQDVGQGQVIGAVGVTGNVTGPHLHLELRPQGGTPVDPIVALSARGVELAPGH